MTDTPWLLGVRVGPLSCRRLCRNSGRPVNMGFGYVSGVGIEWRLFAGQAVLTLARPRGRAWRLAGAG